MAFANPFASLRRGSLAPATGSISGRAGVGTTRRRRVSKSMDDGSFKAKRKAYNNANWNTGSSMSDTGDIEEQDEQY